MKKYLTIAFTLVVAILITACSNVVEPSEGLKIVATNFPGYDFARAIVGNEDEVTMLLKPGQDSHTYDPTPQDIIRINEADIFIYTGGESDSWVDEMLKSIDNEDLVSIRMMDYVEIFKEEIIDGMQDHHHHDEHGHGHAHEHGYDEHIWTSPVNAIRLIEVIENEISNLDNDNANTYQDNANAYIKRITEIDSAIREVIANSERTELIFGDRFPFRYFVEEYNLTYYAAFPGCSSETEASAQTIAFLVDKVKENNIPVVYHIELSNTNIVNTIADETGAKVLQLHSVHNLTDADFAEGKTYADFMEENIQNLKEGLQ
jgi:ABC-type metal ion transport system, periplasmic component/surface adhesin